MIKSRLLLAALAVPYLVLGAGATPARADGVTVTGAGSTFSQIAIDQWRADVAAKYGLNITYSGVGSSAGRQFYIGNQVDFAATEIPFLPNEVDQLKSQGKSYVYSPIVAGATSLMYNLKDASGQQVSTLKLSSKTLAGIFTGTITSWTDPDIKADNPGLDLSQNPTITPVIRSDGSGTSAQFSAYLKAKEPAAWTAFTKSQGYADDETSNYPQFGNAVAQKGSDGVANYVANGGSGLGAIAYVETGYAIERDFPVASVKNASGAYTQPTSPNVSTALAKATLNADNTQNLGGVYDNPDPSTYPISSYSYFVVPSTGFNTDKGKVLGEFMIYFACAGQQKAATLGYAPLPPNLVQTVFSVIKQIPGAPTPPPLSQCANPTIAGAVDGGIAGTSATQAVATSTKAAGTKGSTSKGSGSSPVPGGSVVSAAAGAPAGPGTVVDPATALLGGSVLSPGATAPVSAGTAPDQVLAAAAAGAVPDQAVRISVRAGSGSALALPGVLLVAALVGPVALAGPGQRGLRWFRRRRLQPKRPAPAGVGAPTRTGP